MTSVAVQVSASRQVGLVNFIDGYRAEVIRCTDALLTDLPRAASHLRAALDGDPVTRPSVYFLGNGGSSAIARTLALAAGGTLGHGARWVGAWNQHRLADASTRLGFDRAAAELLRRDGADERNLVVLISGSGNSRNLLAVARTCRDRGIPLLTITGRGGGALAVPDPHGLRVDSTDQQVIEEVAHAAGIALLRRLAGHSERQIRTGTVHAVAVPPAWLHGPRTGSAGGRTCQRRHVRSGTSINRVNLVVDMPASTRITSAGSGGLRRAQAMLGGVLPDPQLHRRLTERGGEVGDLGLELLLPRQRLPRPRRQAGAAGLEELPLPVPDRLLETFACRAAAATVSSPDRTDTTMRCFSAGGRDGGRGARRSRAGQRDKNYVCQRS